MAEASRFRGFTKEKALQDVVVGYCLLLGAYCSCDNAEESVRIGTAYVYLTEIHDFLIGQKTIERIAECPTISDLTREHVKRIKSFRLRKFLLLARKARGLPKLETK